MPEPHARCSSAASVWSDGPSSLAAKRKHKPDAASESAGPPAADFKLLTNHGQTLLLISHDPRARMRDIAALLNITERAAQRIVADLVRAGYVHRQRDGRRNRYSVRTELPLTLPVQHNIQVGSLLAALLPQSEPTDTATH